MRYCQTCGNEMHDEEKFCQHCGRAVEETPKKCNQCGAELREDAAFCPQCGHPVNKKGQSSSNQSSPVSQTTCQTPANQVPVNEYGFRMGHISVQASSQPYAPAPSQPTQSTAPATRPTVSPLYQSSPPLGSRPSASRTVCVPSKKSVNGLGLAGMIVGIVSLAFGGWLGLILGIIATSLSGVAYSRREDHRLNGFAITGLVCGIASTVWSFITLLIW